MVSLYQRRFQAECLNCPLQADTHIRWGDFAGIDDLPQLFADHELRSAARERLVADFPSPRIDIHDPGSLAGALEGMDAVVHIASLHAHGTKEMPVAPDVILYRQMKKSARLVSIATLVITVLGVIPAYFILWDKPDLVYDQRPVDIPIPAALRERMEKFFKSSAEEQAREFSRPRSFDEIIRLRETFMMHDMPDKLLYVNIKNVGHRPTSLIKARVAVPGIIMGKELKDAGPIMGRLENVASWDMLPPVWPLGAPKPAIGPGEIYFECPSLANHSSARIALSIWYFQEKEGQPSLEILESSAGPAREVPSVAEAEFWLSRILKPILFGVIGAALAIMLLQMFLRRPSILP